MLKHRLRRKRASTPEDADFSLTPMLDVVFILLIFFIVTASFVEKTGIEVALPVSKTAAQQKDASVFIAIDEQGEIWIDKQRVDIRMLRVYLDKVRSENPQAAAMVVADQASRNATLLKVLDQIRLAGIAKIAIAADIKH